MSETYLDGPEWRELVTEQVLGRPNLVWRKRPKHVLDLLDLAPDTDAIDFLVQGTRRTGFAQLRQATENTAAQFKALGIRPGEKVLLILYNSPEVLLAQWGLWRLGAVPVFGNRWWTEHETIEVIGRVRPRLILTDLPSGGDAFDGVPILRVDALRAWWKPASEQVADPRAQSDEDDLAMIVFTAGSTGRPKGVQLTHRILIWSQQTLHNMRPARPPLPANPAEQKVTLMTTPMFHNGAIVTGLAALIDGNRMVLLEGKFLPGEVLRLIEEERVTAWQAVPTMFARLLQHPDFVDHDLTSLVAPSSGGMMVPEPLIEAIDEKMPWAGGNLVIGYGMTEMSFLTMATRREMRERPGTVGLPIPGVELKVDATDADGEGELLGRSAALMIGYLGAEAQPIDAEGWYRTGDRGRIDADGYAYVTGRVKDMIIRGGENISCAHVEAAILAHPGVLEVAVCGYPDEQLGEQVAAFVRVRPEFGLNDAELAGYARTKLAYFCVPSLWRLQTDPLPVLATGKVDKVMLERALREELPPHG